MAQLPDYENPQYPDVYELAEDDPVAGGPDGVDNLPHKQLKERTDYLKQEIEGTQQNVSSVSGRVLSLEASSAGSVGRAVPLSWEYSDRGFDFELFSAGFTWRDMEPITVVQTVAGDESVDVESTDNLEVGGTYVIYTSTGRAHTVRVDAILSPVRFRAAQELTASLAGAKMARTSWKVEAGYATAADGALFYTRPVTALRFYEDGRVIIRRGDGDGALSLQYRNAGSIGEWSPAILERTLSRESGTRDEEWRIIGGSDLELRVAAAHGESGEDITVYHLVAFPGEQAGRAFEVAQPEHVAPEDGAAGLTDTLTLQATPYKSLYGIAQADAEFRIGTELEMSNIVYVALAGSPADSHQVAPGNLDIDSVYFWQARYQDEDGTWSPWSVATAFSTGTVFQYVRQPLNTSPAEGSGSASVVPSLQAGSFTVIGGEDAHAASQWQVATDSNFSNIIHDSGETVTDLTSHRVPSDTLQDQQTYYFRVRYKGETLGFSPYSKGTAFTTQAVPSAPVITAPEDGASEVSGTPLLKTSSFFIPGGGDSHSRSQYQLATDAAFSNIAYDSGTVTDLTQHTVPTGSALSPDTAYYVRARHQGVATGFGSWSNPVSFTTFTQYVNTPSIQSPSAGETDVPESPVITSTAFSATPSGADSHAASSWQLRNSGGTVIWSSLNDTGNKTSIAIPAGELSVSSTYSVQVRHHGASLPDSPWSAPVSFTTSDTFIPENGAAGTAFGGGYFTSRMVDEVGAPYALVTAPKAEGEASGTMSWQQAKDWCEGLTVGGHSDWQLATLDERIAEYRALKPTTQDNSTSYGDSTLIDPPTSNYTAGSPSQTAIDAFRDGGSEAFIANSYWSATESSSSYAYRVYFNLGVEVSNANTNNFYVRAVRRVYF
jgi:hypothetical protein